MVRTFVLLAIMAWFLMLIMPIPTRKAGDKIRVLWQRLSGKQAKIWNSLIGRQRVFVGHGSWHDRRNWAKSRHGTAGAAIPTAKDDVHIPLGIDVDVRMDGVMLCRNLTVDGSMLVV